MKNTDIKNVLFHNNNASAVYYGTSLLWKKQEDNPDNQLVFLMSNAYADVINETLDTSATVRYYGESNQTINGVFKTKYNTKYLVYNFEKPVEYFSLNPNVKNMIMYCSNYFDNSVDGSHWKYWNSLFENSKIIYCTIDFNNVEDSISFEKTFMNCKQLTSVTINTPTTIRIGSIYGTFANCNNLREIYFDDDIDFSEISGNNKFSSAFYNCTSLTNFYSRGIYFITFSLDFSESPLSNDSAMLFINGLEYVNNETISFSTTTFNELTEEQIALATAKGWSVISG